MSMDFAAYVTPSAITAFFEILFIDIVLAGDNAIVVGALAAGLPAEQRKKVIMIGVLAALVLRIAFALVVSQLLQVVGLVLAGGLLLLWVAWKMYREIRDPHENPGSEEVVGDERSGVRMPKSFASAAWGVAVADISMSLDNVLAVAGVGPVHPNRPAFWLLQFDPLKWLRGRNTARFVGRYRQVSWGGVFGGRCDGRHE